MKRKVLWLIAALLIAAAAAGYLSHHGREQRFLDRAFVQLRGGGGSQPVAEIALGSGESAAVILEHGCCSGAGFDAVAVRTSDGQEFFAERNYCGLEGFRMELDAPALEDLLHFTAVLRGRGFEQR